MKLFIALVVLILTCTVGADIVNAAADATPVLILLPVLVAAGGLIVYGLFEEI